MAHVLYLCHIFFFFKIKSDLKILKDFARVSKKKNASFNIYTAGQWTLFTLHFVKIKTNFLFFMQRIIQLNMRCILDFFFFLTCIKKSTNQNAF